MTNEQRIQLEEFGAHFEELWGHIDDIFDSLSSDDWAKPHGPDWINADVPFHIAYYDREVVADPLVKGSDVPVEERLELSTINELNAWNAAHFAARPADQTVERSLEQMLASREACREAMAQMTDADLERPAWFPLMFLRGWQESRTVLRGCRAHTANHLMELRLRLSLDGHRPSPPLMHAFLGDLMPSLREIAAQGDKSISGVDFTMIWEFTGPGGGDWTMTMSDGEARINQERAANPDLVLAQSPETFLKTNLGLHDPMEAIQSGEIQVNDLEAMATLGQLMAPPSSDYVFKPVKY